MKLLEFFEEDIGGGDVTTEVVIPNGVKARAVIYPRERCVLAGIEEVVEFYEHMKVNVVDRRNDGEWIGDNEPVIVIEDEAKKLLTLERVVLNFLSRMSGIATITRDICSLAEKYNPKIKIATTRKTIPGWRVLDKKAAIIGGAIPHRYFLSDHVLIKDNHLSIIPMRDALKKARDRCLFKKVEIEVSSVENAIIAAEEGADVIMLDNMNVNDIDTVLKKLKDLGLRDRIVIEVSGGVNPDNIHNYVKLDVDVISMGYITHSARSVDFTMDLEKVQQA